MGCRAGWACLVFWLFNSGCKGWSDAAGLEECSGDVAGWSAPRFFGH